MPLCHPGKGSNGNISDGLGLDVTSESWMLCGLTWLASVWERCHFAFPSVQLKGGAPLVASLGKAWPSLFSACSGPVTAEPEDLQRMHVAAS